MRLWLKRLGEKQVLKIVVGVVVVAAHLLYITASRESVVCRLF